MSHWKRIAALCLALFVLAAAGCSSKKDGYGSGFGEQGKLQRIVEP